jgi:PTH1 family peptidyl-tRNA hydrolase
MKIIVGLGNPGTQYVMTRHNAGFRVAEHIAATLGVSWQDDRRNHGFIAEAHANGEKVLLVRPSTYMNESGICVAPLINFYKISLESLLVITDDLDLPVGKIRMRSNGKDGGQRGIRSIITHLGSEQFPRLRVGIGRPPNARMDTITYVLGIPPGEERTALESSEMRAAEAALVWIREGTTSVMNRYNADPKPTEEPTLQPQTE